MIYRVRGSVFDVHSSQRSSERAFIGQCLKVKKVSRLLKRNFRIFESADQELDSHLRNRTYLPTSLTSRNGRTRRPDRERWLISRNHSCGVHEPVPIRRREICSRNELRRELGVILNVVERLQESLTNDTPSLQPYYIMLVEALS